MARLIRLAQFFTKYVSLWVIAIAVYSYFQPGTLKPMGKYIPYLLGLIMLSMGITLKLEDFKIMLARPRDVFFGIALRYLIMPLAAWGTAKLLGLPPALAAGLILVGCCPSGTASNVMTFIAKGDMALSICVTSLNTLLAPILTPILFLLLAGTVIPFDPVALLLDIVKIVLIPVILGMLIRAVAAKQVIRLQPVIPAVSVMAIVVTVGAVVAISAAKVAGVALLAMVAVAIHNALGLSLGYGCAKGLGMQEAKARAVAYEVGMENSGLAVALAVAHLDPLAAIPGVIFSVWHNFSGSLLASYWIKKDLQALAGEERNLENRDVKVHMT